MLKGSYIPKCKMLKGSYIPKCRMLKGSQFILMHTMTQKFNLYDKI